MLAQLNKVINAPSIEEMREGKEILANEIGVVFNKNKGKKAEVPHSFDPNIVSTTGTVEGGVYSNRAAHFEWLCDVGHSLGLQFEDLGKRRHGTKATLHFCDKLYEIYGSEDLSVSLGASFAIEHWANAGFWDDLVDGFSRLNKRDGPGVVLPDGKVSHTAPLGFWKVCRHLQCPHPFTIRATASKHRWRARPTPTRAARRVVRLCRAVPPGARGAARGAHDGRA